MWVMVVVAYISALIQALFLYVAIDCYKYVRDKRAHNMHVQDDTASWLQIVS
jgi:hypothetical protein